MFRVRRPLMNLGIFLREITWNPPLSAYSDHHDNDRLKTLIDKNGFVDVDEKKEKLMFFANVVPIKRARFDFRHIVTRKSNSAIEALIRKLCLPRELVAPDAFNITATIPRPKDGGVFIKYKTLDKDSTDVDQRDLEIAGHLSRERPRRWFLHRRIKAFPVLGQPWLDEMGRFPSRKLRVDFAQGTGPGWLGPQALYRFFRKYGKIADIIPQPSTCPIRPRYAIVKYLRIDGAMAARNCLDGFVSPDVEKIYGEEKGVRLSILYERDDKLYWLRETLSSHQRITIPLAIVILGLTFVAIFDPVRVWFVELKITGFVNYCKHSGFMFMSDIGKLFPIIFPDQSTIKYFFRDQKPSGVGSLSCPESTKTREKLEQLDKWLQEDSDRSIVMVGRRRDKLDLITKYTSLSTRENILVIDCRPIAEAVDNTATITAFAKQVGYRPVFSTFNLLFDLFLQAAMGNSEGLGKSVDTQLEEILQATRVALKRVALRERAIDGHLAEADGISDKASGQWIRLPKEWDAGEALVRDSEVDVRVDGAEPGLDGVEEVVAAGVVCEPLKKDLEIGFGRAQVAELKLSPQQTENATCLMSDDAYLRENPGNRPVLIIDNFRHHEGKSAIYEKIAEFASQLVYDHQTHVIFLADNRSFEKSFPSPLFRNISCDDDPPLQTTPQDSRQLRETISEVIGLYLRPGKSTSKKRAWTIEQTWFLVRGLAKKEVLKYDEVLLDKLFKLGGDEALLELEKMEMITMDRDEYGAKPSKIKVGRQVTTEAFKLLAGESGMGALAQETKEGCEEIRNTLDTLTLRTRTNLEKERIKRIEEQLRTLASLKTMPQGRERYLLNRAEIAQRNIEGFEKKIKRLKKKLKGEAEWNFFWT